MQKFKTYNTNNKQKHIKIKIINLGAVASNTTVESSLFNDVKTHNITDTESISEPSIKHFIDDSDIVFLVADLDDDFVVKNILTIIKVLTKYKKMFTTILANADTSQAIRDKSSLLIVENQDDISIKTKITVAHKFKKIIHVLCDLIDEEIEEIRVHDTMLSSLISLSSFFSEKSELYLYIDYTESQVKQNLKLRSLLDQSNQIWIRLPFVKEDPASNIKINEFINFFETNIDEDAPCFLSHKINTKRSMKEIKLTVLIAVFNNTEKSI